jgi:hypothetical protein
LVTLQSFEAGWGWDAQLRQYIRKKYHQDLAGLIHLDPQALARLMRGEILGDRPYATVQWVLRLTPFRPLELYWLFDYEEEFGHDLHVLYAPKSLVVPTEDAYVFAWDYLALLARYGRGAFPLTEAGPGPEWLLFTDFAPQAAGPIKDKALGVRDELLRLINADLVEVAVCRLDCGASRPYGDGWEVSWPILGDLAMQLRYHSQELEIAFDSHGAKKYGHDFLLSFTWLYLNALLRECRQVEPSLPRLSHYL